MKCFVFEMKEGDQMKSLLVKLGVILIGLELFTCAEVWGADWKLYCSNEIYLGYYDAQSITRPSENIGRLWLRWDYTEKSVLGYVRALGKKYENLSQSRNLVEINCLEKKTRRLSTTYYDKNGEVLYSDDSPTEWIFIIPESMGESLYKEVCK
jgi:hypothetical protein